jgi:hypothetical protein
MPDRQSLKIGCNRVRDVDDDFVRQISCSLQRFSRVLILHRKQDDVSLADSIPHNTPFDLRADFLSQGYGLIRILLPTATSIPFEARGRAKPDPILPDPIIATVMS